MFSLVSRHFYPAITRPFYSNLTLVFYILSFGRRRGSIRLPIDGSDYILSPGISDYTLLQDEPLDEPEVKRQQRLKERAQILDNFPYQMLRKILVRLYGLRSCNVRLLIVLPRLFRKA